MSAVTIDGIEYIPATEKAKVEDERDSYRRTLALAHSHLVMDGESGRDRAVAVIQRGTGWGLGEAQAIAGIVAWANENRTTEQPDGAHDEGDETK